MGEVKRYTNGTTGGPVFVDVQDGKILRITAAGRSTRPTLRRGPSTPGAGRSRRRARPTASPWTVAHRSTIYSPKRILTPLKRVDFDPQGRAQHPEPRRLRLRAHQLGRGARHGGRGDRSGIHREVGPAGDAVHSRLAPPVGQRRLPAQRPAPLPQPDRLHLRRAQPGQLGGLALGRHAHVGLQPPPGHPRAVRAAGGRAQAHRPDHLLVGRPRGELHRRVRRQRRQRPPPLAARNWASR